MSNFGLTDAELQFLAAHVKPSSVVWEWGSGGTTAFLAPRCKRLTAVEHQAAFAASAIMEARFREHTNVSVLYVPPDYPYVEGGEYDGDATTFRHYVRCYTGQGVDVALIDGRARVACADHILNHAAFGPNPEMLIFAHDIERPQLAPILDMYREEERVERLALLRVRTD